MKPFQQNGTQQGVLDFDRRQRDSARIQEIFEEDIGMLRYSLNDKNPYVLAATGEAMVRARDSMIFALETLAGHHHNVIPGMTPDYECVMHIQAADPELAARLWGTRR